MITVTMKTVKALIYALNVRRHLPLHRRTAVDPAQVPGNHKMDGGGEPALVIARVTLQSSSDLAQVSVAGLFPGNLPTERRVGANQNKQSKTNS